MKKVILLFFVLFVGVAGFANVGNGDFGFERLEVVEFNGGEITIGQGINDIEIVIYDNENNLASALVTNSNGSKIFQESFIGDGIIIVNKSNLDKGIYTLTVKAGSNKRVLDFVVD